MEEIVKLYGSNEKFQELRALVESKAHNPIWISPADPIKFLFTYWQHIQTQLDDLEHKLASVSSNLYDSHRVLETHLNHFSLNEPIFEYNEFISNTMIQTHRTNRKNIKIYEINRRHNYIEHITLLYDLEENAIKKDINSLQDKIKANNITLSKIKRKYGSIQEVDAKNYVRHLKATV